MIRPMTSSVTALWGGVANGHQAIHFVSSAPSKIPYGGFSPVRLQTRETHWPPSQARPRLFIGQHGPHLYWRRFIRSWTRVQAAPPVSDQDCASSGPWLPTRLYCPGGSLLTMATSAPLSATQRLMHYSARLRHQPASRRGSPIYPASPLTPCRGPYSGGSRDCTRRCLHHGYRLRRIRSGSATTNSHKPECVGRVTKLQPSLNGTAWRSCLPCSGQDFYYRAFAVWVTPMPRVGYCWMASRHLPPPDFRRLDCQSYGLRTD
jgi:hypothetical protein